MKSEYPIFKPVLLRGNYFRCNNAKSACELLSSGDALMYEREPFNKYDSQAIKILSIDGLHLGYIEKELSYKISPYIDSGIIYMVSVMNKVKINEIIFPTMIFYPVKSKETEKSECIYLTNLLKKTKSLEVA